MIHRGIVLIAALALAGCVANRIQEGQIELSYSDGAAEFAPAAAERADHAVKKIVAFWGEDYTRTIRINIDSNERRSNTRISDNFISLALPSAKPGSSTIEHELTHVIVGTDPSMRRYLIEGIAMYCEARFSHLNGNTPERMAQLIDDRARKEIKESRYIRLERTDGAIIDTALAYPKQRATAYFEAASFVKYLLDTYGIAKFKRVYRGFDFDPVYAKTLEHLEAEWLDATFPELGGHKLMITETAAG